MSQGASHRSDSDHLLGALCRRAVLSDEDRAFPFGTGLYADLKVVTEPRGTETQGMVPRRSDQRAELDETDRRILGILQRDARIPNTELADEVGLTPAPR